MRAIRICVWSLEERGDCVSKIFRMALCEGRHEIPDATDGAVFGYEINPLDPESLEREAGKRLKEMQVKDLHLYVTGLTVALVAVLNATKKLKINIVLYHYNKDDDTYFVQHVK